MNQEKIGKFIASERKKKNLTQKQLAEKLSISEKTVSKWECGKGLPEISLMKPVCKELDISVNELLNGAKDSEEDKVIIEYINYEKKKSKKKIITLTIVFILLITFILSTVIYFFNSYNKIAVYDLYGESKNFSYSNGLLIKSNIYNIFQPGKIIAKNQEISEDNITSYIFKCGNIRIVGHGGENTLSSFSTTLIEKNGYNEILSPYKLNNLNKWTLTIWYKYKGETFTEIINIENKEIMRNNEFVSIKTHNISDDTKEEKESAEDKRIGKELENNRNYYTKLLKEEGYHPTKDNKYKLKKEITEKEYLIFNTDTEILEYHNRKNENNFTIVQITVLPQTDGYYDNDMRRAVASGLNDGKEFSYMYFINRGSYGYIEEKDLQPNRYELMNTYMKHLEIMEQIIYP
jgi:transcriptional regulator with XRE-family HTH domain